MADQIQELTEQLTQAEQDAYEAKAAELTDELKTPVYPFVFIDPETLERIAAFVKQPSYIITIRITDKVFQAGLGSARDELREICVIKDASHYLTYSEGNEGGAVKRSLNVQCWELFMTQLPNQFKKKTVKKQ